MNGHLLGDRPSVNCCKHLDQTTANYWNYMQRRLRTVIALWSVSTDRPGPFSRALKRSGSGLSQQSRRTNLWGMQASHHGYGWHTPGSPQRGLGSRSWLLDVFRVRLVFDAKAIYRVRLPFERETCLHLRYLIAQSTSYSSRRR